jgi:hypothetical protein
MEDPTRELPPLIFDLPDYDPIAEIRDIRAWRAEQRAKYGMDWEDTHPPGISDYERSRGLIPPDTPIPSEQRRLQK